MGCPCQWRAARWGFLEGEGPTLQGRQFPAGMRKSRDPVPRVLLWPAAALSFHGSICLTKGSGGRLYRDQEGHQAEAGTRCCRVWLWPWVGPCGEFSAGSIVDVRPLLLSAPQTPSRMQNIRLLGLGLCCHVPRTELSPETSRSGAHGCACRPRASLAPTFWEKLGHCLEALGGTGFKQSSGRAAG